MSPERRWLQLTYPDQDPLVLEVEVSDGQLVGERHVCGVLCRGEGVSNTG